MYFLAAFISIFNKITNLLFSQSISTWRFSFWILFLFL